VGVPNAADTLAARFISSRTLFSRVPTDLVATRAAIAARLSGPRAQKSASRPAIALGERFDYTLVYRAADAGGTITISDLVPSVTTVLTASGSKAPGTVVAGQQVTWSVPVVAGEAVTLTIAAQGSAPGLAHNTAAFAGPDLLYATATVLVRLEAIMLPLVVK
jgi:hypothetical protein